MFNESYESGEKAFYAALKSPSLSWLNPQWLQAEIAIHYFLPPTKEARVQMSTPHPKGRVEWMRGWTEAQRVYNEEHQEC